MDRQTLRLEVLRMIVQHNNPFHKGAVLDTAKKYEEYITSSVADKEESPADVVKEQQIGKAAPSKRKPRK